jgi:hypothetical protein
MLTLDGTKTVALTKPTEVGDLLQGAGYIQVTNEDGVALPASTSHRRHHRIGTTNLADVGNGDIRAGGRKSLRNCSPNVAGTSGHERNFSIEIHGAPFESRQASTVNDESISLSSKAANANIQVRNASPRVPRRHGATLHGGGLACDGRA